MNTFEKISDDKFKNDVIEKNAMSELKGGSLFTANTYWANGTLTCDQFDTGSRNHETGSFPKEDVSVVGNGGCTK